MRPVAETPRLRLRRLDAGDAGFLLELLNDPEFVRFVGDRGVRSLDDARGYLARGPLASYRDHGFGLYHVGLREGGVPIGICGLLKRDALDAVDLGFALLPGFRSRGYASEAAAVVMDEARERYGLERVLAITDPANDASIRVLEKLGFRFERRVRLAAGEPELKLFAWSA